MVLLRGAGLELRFSDGQSRTLRRVGELAEFDGALSTHCQLLNGPCVDLNLMVLKSDTVAAGVQRFVEPLTLNASPDEATLVFSIYETIVIDTTTWESATLEPWDLAVLSGCGARLSRLEPVDPADSADSAVSADARDHGGAGVRVHCDVERAGRWRDGRPGDLRPDSRSPALLVSRRYA